MGSTETYDVAIIGAGFEGSMLGTILAHAGAKVLIIEAGTHPRFVLGESTVRHTFRMMKIMAERFQVPDFLEKFNAADKVHTLISSNCGEKRNFGFVYHREGQHQNPREADQLVIPPFREGYEAHLFRQDIDQWLTYTAVHHGATVKYKTFITDVEIDEKGVTLTTAKGEVYKARFVADASGAGSPVAKKFNLRDNPPRVKTNSRCLFTHMIDVKEYDDLKLPNGIPPADERWYNGTCHHIFDGGWLWVIPFNNRKGSTNPAVSVGLSLDNARFPRPTDMTPEQEWDHFLSRFPSIREQFKDAKAVREWISSDRLQNSVKQCVGYRYVLMASVHGAGFMDALFSRGLANSSECINAVAPRLLQALKDDDFAPERFAYVQTLLDNNLRNSDMLVNAAYISFRDFELWNAWFRIWALGVGLGDLRLASLVRQYVNTRDEAHLPDNQEPMGLFFANHLGFKELFEKAVAKMNEVEAGTASNKEATDYIFSLIRNANFTPRANQLWDPDAHVINAGKAGTMVKTVAWLVSSAPADIRQWSFSAGSGLFYRKENHPAAATPAREPQG